VLRRVLLWQDVKSVTLAFRGKNMMALFEVEATGWKVLFSKDQEQEVRDVLDEMLPDVVIDVLNQRKE
jgi:hypothetical protein